MVPLQILLIAFAMSGFRQAWNVEVEHGADDDDDRGGATASSAERGDASPASAPSAATPGRPLPPVAGCPDERDAGHRERDAERPAAR